MSEELLSADIQGIVFSGSTLLGYFLTGCVYLLLPVLAFLLLKKYNAARIYPVIVGAVVYFLSTRLCDLCAHLVGASQNRAMKAVIAAELVCIFEEAGRWLAIKYPVSDIKTTGAALCYGIGHGGLECWFRGMDSFSVFRIGQQVCTRGAESFTAGKTPEKAAEIIEQLREYADHPLYLSVFDQLSLITIFAVQIALSLLVFRKLRENARELRWLMAAVLLHYFLNCVGWLVSLAGSALLCDITGIVCGVAVIAVVFRSISARECIDDVLFPPIEKQNL